MQIGDQIVSVNAIQVNTMKYDEIMKLLHDTKEPVEFQVTKPDVMARSSSAQNTTTASSNNVSGSTSPLTSNPKPFSPGGSNKQSTESSVSSPVKTAAVNHLAQDKSESSLKKDTIESNPRTNAVKVGEETWIEIERGKLGLGLSLVGGSDTQLAGIIIHDVYVNGAAFRDMRLSIGDQILRVNDIDLTNATHEQALSALRQTSDTVKLLVHRSIMARISPDTFKDSNSNYKEDRTVTRSGGGSSANSGAESNSSNGVTTPSSSIGFADLISTENEKYLNIFSVELNKKFGKGLGFSIIGRRDGSGVFISHIVSFFFFFFFSIPLDRTINLKILLSNF